MSASSSSPAVLNSLLRHKRFDLVPRSHWRSLDRDGRYEVAADNLQLALINYVRRPSRTIELRPADGDGSLLFGVHLDHDELMAKLWKYLAIALMHREDCPVDGFRVVSVQLAPSVMAQLAKALRAKHLKKLVLHDNDFGGAGIAFAADVIDKNASLRYASFNYNPVDDLDSAFRLADALDNHPLLESLSFRYCGFGENSTTLSAIISACKNVKFLDLRNTDMGSEGAAIVSQFLASNPPRLETLNLSGNNFNDEDADAIARGLSTNANLNLLYLSNNPILESGRKSLLRAIYDTTSLNATSHSNHTCELVFDQMQTAHEQLLLINNFTTPDTNRRRKIVFAIHDAVVGNCDFGSLETVPEQLAPDVLGLIQFGPMRYMSSSLMYNYSLTLSYEVLRRWLCGFLGV